MGNSQNEKPKPIKGIVGIVTGIVLLLATNALLLVASASRSLIFGSRAGIQLSNFFLRISPLVVLAGIIISILGASVLMDSINNQVK